MFKDCVAVMTVGIGVEGQGLCAICKADHNAHAGVWYGQIAVVSVMYFVPLPWWSLEFLCPPLFLCVASFSTFMSLCGGVPLMYEKWSSCAARYRPSLYVRLNRYAHPKREFSRSRNWTRLHEIGSGTQVVQ